jgi:hypothetical protein
MTDTTKTHDAKAEARAEAKAAPDLTDNTTPGAPPPTPAKDSPRTGKLKPTFPGFDALVAAKITTYEELSAFAPEYRITGIDADTAKLIDEAVNAPIEHGVPASICISNDIYAKGEAFRHVDKAGNESWDVVADGGEYLKARLVAGRATVPGEFVLVEPEPEPKPVPKSKATDHK